MWLEFRISKETKLDSFHRFMRTYYPDIASRKRFACTPQEVSAELREVCQKFHVELVPISTFKEQTFTAEEVAALKIVVDYAAKHCGGGEDTIGAIMYTGAFRKLKDGDAAVVALADKINCYN